MKKTRSTRTQRLARWLNSRVFWIWLALSIVSATAHITIPFAPGSNNNVAARRIFLFEGASATMNVYVCGDVIVIWPSSEANLKMTLRQRLEYYFGVLSTWFHQAGSCLGTCRRLEHGS
jgi:hypothetical protein